VQYVQTLLEVIYVLVKMVIQEMGSIVMVPIHLIEKKEIDLID